MKEASPHIITPAVQNRLQPFFQRSVEEGKEDSAFFSGVQTKLNVSQKDDPYETEADAMADKVVKGPHTEAPLSNTAGNPVQTTGESKGSEPATNTAQMKFESSDDQELQKKEDKESGNEISAKAPVSADTNSNTMQRWCRECDEGDKVFREEDPQPNTEGMSKREAVIAMAKTMLGKIKAKQAGAGGERVGARELWEIFKLAAPGVWSEETVKTFGQKLPSWCGIFTVWAHKKSGIDLGNWQMGKGVSAFGTLKQTGTPQPGDIGYIDQPFQHHALITKVDSNIESIDGNSGLFSEVIENTRPKTAYTNFYTGYAATDSGTASPKSNDTVQQKGDGAQPIAPSTVEASITSSKGTGDRLPESTRSEMESGLGGDFSNVRIHTDTEAARMNKDLNAQAFTHGGDIYFNENKYNPETFSGKHLLAHELTHAIQQGAAGVQKKSSSKLPRICKKISRKLVDEAEGLAVGDMYEINFKNGKKHTLDRGKMVLEMPEITLPALKKRNEKKYQLPVLSMKGRGKTLQVDNWEKAVSSKVNAKLAERFKADDPNWKPSNILYYNLDKRRDFHLIGTFEQIQKLAYIPRWNRKGEPNFHQVDHIVEYQLGGADQPETTPTNYELLDSKANMSSGSAIRNQRKKRVEESLAYFKEMHTDKKSKVYKKFTYLPKADKVLKEWEMQFKEIDNKWNLPYKGDGDVYWTYEEMALPGDPVFLKHIRKMDSKEVADAKGNPNEILIYGGEAVGGGKKLKMPFKGPVKDFFLGMDLTFITITGGAPGQKAGEIKFELNRDFTKNVKEKDDPQFELTAVADGRQDTYFIKPKKDFNRNLFKKFEGLSPVVVNDLLVDSVKGIMITGTITADVALFKGFEIDFMISAAGFEFSTMIDASVISNCFPKPFIVNNAGLEISYTSKNNSIGLIGYIDFEIEKIGRGKLNAGKKGAGFMVKGDFNFDPSLFVGELHFTYQEEKWTIGGSASMDGKKIKGIKSAKINFEYSQANENLHVGGEAFLTVPGISKVTVDTNIGKDGDFNVTAGVELEKIPRIKSGKVTVTIGKIKPAAGQQEGDSEWDLGITGDITPDFDYDGLTISEVKFTYGKGAYDISISGKYTRGKIHADTIKVGLTNKPVSADGKTVTDGEPAKDMTFYGQLKMGVDIYEGIGGTIDCVLKPDGDITLDGSIEVQEDKQLFSVDPVNKEIFKVDKDIPIASCVVVTLNLYIGGSIKLYAELKPLMVKKGSNIKIGNLSLKKYDDPVITSKIVLGSSLLAGAKVTLAVGLSASLLGIIKARIKGEAAVNFVAIEADITGVLDMGWKKGTGLEINEASISLEMASKLIVSFGVTAEVLIDLWLTTISVWENTWPVAEDTFPIDIFGEGKKTWQLPLESGGKVGKPKTEDNLKDVKDKATPEEVQSRAKDKSEGVKRPKVDKQAEVQKVTQDEVLAQFRKPERFFFDRSENYLETRYGLYDYLKLHSGEDPKIDLTFIDEEIKKAEFEEYDAFTLFVMNDTTFNNDSKSIIIEDFIINHPTLGNTEKVNLRSLIPVKAPPSQKASPKDRGKSVPKRTPEITTPVRPIQAKAKAGGSGKSGSVTARRGKHVLKNKSQKNPHKTSEGNDLMDLDVADGLSEFEWPVAEDKAAILSEMNGFDEVDNDDTFKPFYMRPYTRTRKPLQQRASEKNQSPFFSGPQKKEKTNGAAFFQAKLNIGAVEDPQEKEAESVADKVVSQGPKMDDKKGMDKTAAISKPEEKKDKEAVQKKSKDTDEKEEKDKKLDKKANTSNNSPAKGKSIETSLSEKNGTGNQLPANALHEMQQSFDKDFSDVRIHTDNEATELSNELDAQAFTTGKDIYFNSGKFDPGSAAGKHLLAHELTHVVQQNSDTIQRAPKKDKDPEATRAQSVRDNYQKALKNKVVDWREVALYFNAFNAPEMQSKMAQLNARQLFLLHRGAVYGAGVGPWSAAALNTNPVPGMESRAVAAIEEKILISDYQGAINLMVDELDKLGVIDKKLLWGGTFHYLNQNNLKGEGRVLAPGYDAATGKAKPTASNIGSDAFGEDKGIPFLYSTIIHEYQHVQQMQKKEDAKSLLPGQSADEDTHLQQEVEAYGTELINAKQTGLYNIPDQIEDTWNRLQQRWEQLSDTRKQVLKDLYKNAYAVAKEALRKKSFLVYTPVK